MSEAKGGFGADVIQRLIPHRRPFLMVDRVEGWSLSPTAELSGCRLISVNEPVFEGHFPGWSLWPGVLTIEGLGQSSMILAILKRLCEAAEGRGIGTAEVRGALRSLDEAYHLRPGRRSELAGPLLEGLGEPGGRIGMASDIDVKLLAPVFAGQRLDYQVRLTHDAGSVMRFDVAASVDRRQVARGTIGAAFDARAALVVG